MFKDLLTIKPEEKVKEIVLFLKEKFKQQQIENAVIGLSGGIDSAVSLTLLSKALPINNIFVYHLPYFEEKTNEIDELFNFLNFPKKNVKIISIKEKVDDLTLALKIPENDLVRRGNLMARLRMITLFDSAKQNHAMVVGTENRSEHFLGYFTRFGDEASDIEPIKHLYKTQVYELAKYLEIPKYYIDKKPSADLWGGQSDESELGFNYEQADPVLFLYFDKKNSAFSISQMIPDAKKIIEAAEKNSFKLKVPYSIS